MVYGCTSKDIVVSTFPTRTVTAGKGNIYGSGNISTGWFCIGF